MTSVDTLYTISRARAALILAVHIGTVDRLIRRGVLTPGRRFATAQLPLEQVEELAMRRRPLKALTKAPTSYWVARSGAATTMGLSEARVAQLTAAGKLPYLVHHTGTRLYRRAQVEVIGNARRKRFSLTGMIDRESR